MKERITGKIIVKGVLELLAPLMIGSGEKEQGIDITVCKDHRGIPYIPSTSVTGALRHYFNGSIDKAHTDKEQTSLFWGTNSFAIDSSRYQSAVSISDLTCVENSWKITIRDGVRIHQRHGTAIDEKKYDYEVVEIGTLFRFRMEVTLREEYDKEWFEEATAFLVDGLIKSKIPLGGMTMKGLGRCELKEVKSHIFDFTNPSDVFSWLNRQYDTAVLKSLRPYKEPRVIALKQRNDLFIHAGFKIKTSLHVRSYSGDPSMPDSVHIRSGDSPVMPGTSLKGTIRARAMKIIHTLHPVLHRESIASCEDIMQLFGWVSEEKADRKAVKSRLKIEEHLVKHGSEYEHYRIKVDRFTGGTIKGALFDSMPVWSAHEHSTEDNMVSLELQIYDCKDWEAGLFMLVLRDLWIADLPVGGEKGIGRGILTGVEAKVCYNSSEFILTAIDDKQIHIEGNAGEMEAWVQSLLQHNFSKEANHA